MVGWLTPLPNRWAGVWAVRSMRWALTDWAVKPSEGWQKDGSLPTLGRPSDSMSLYPGDSWLSLDVSHQLDTVALAVGHPQFEERGKHEPRPSWSEPVQVSQVRTPLPTTRQIKMRSARFCVTGAESDCWLPVAKPSKPSPILIIVTLPGSPRTHNQPGCSHVHAQACLSVTLIRQGQRSSHGSSPYA